MSSQIHYGNCILIKLYTVGILLEPLSLTAKVYTVQTFTCSGTGVNLFWNIDGTTLTNQTQLERNISVSHNGTVGTNLLSALTIIAQPINDDIDNIGCTIVTTDYTAQQLGAQFNILKGYY